MSQGDHPSPTRVDLENLLTEVKSQIVACKDSKTSLYAAWKAAPKSEKSTLRAEYDEAAEELKSLYTQQKVLQEEMKNASRKAKKRVAPDGNPSRQSPRKKARDSTTESRSGSNMTMVDLDTYAPTPLECISAKEQQPSPNVLLAATTVNNFPSPAPVSPAVTTTPLPPAVVAAGPLPPAISAAAAPPAVVAAAPLLAAGSAVPLPPAIIATRPLPSPISAALPPVVPAEALPPAISTVSLPPAVAAAAPPAITAAPLPPAISIAPLPPVVAAAPPPPATIATPPAVTAAPLPPAISTAPLLHPSALNEASEGLGKLVVLSKDKLRAVTQRKSLKKDQLKIEKNVTLWRDLMKEQRVKLLYEGRKVFNKWTSKGKPIPFRTRLWARCEASFMLELATHSKKLAVMTLTTRVGNRMCHYHTRYTNHTSTDATATEQNLHLKITGVPYTRTAIKARIKKETNDEDDDDDGNATNTSSGSYKPRTSAATVYDNAMSCGCSLEDVLLDFFFWKDTVAVSPTTRIKEGWGGDMMDPRTHTFVCTLLNGQPGIELDWLYEIDAKGKTVTLSHMFHKQGQALREWYQRREMEANPPESDSEDQSLLPETNGESSKSAQSSNKGKGKLLESKTVFKNNT